MHRQSPHISRRTFVLALAIMLADVGLVPCRAGNDAEKIIGTWEGLWLGKTLVQEFQKSHPQRAMTFSPAEVPEVCRSLEQGKSHVGLISHLALVRCQAKPPSDWSTIPLGRFVVAVIVNSRNPVRSMTYPEIADIFSGETKDWSGLCRSVAKVPIELYAPTLTSTESAVVVRTAMWQRLYADELRDANAQPPREKLSTGEIVGAVAKDVRAVAFLKLDPDPELDTRVRVLALAKESDTSPTLPTKENVANGFYPLIDMLTIHIRPDAPVYAKEFCEFVAGPEGAKIIKQFGFWPEYELNELRGQQRLAEVKSGKAAEIVACDVTGSEGVLNDLATEFVKAKAAVRLHFQKKATRDGAIEKFFKGETELLLLDEPMSAIEKRNEAGIPQSAPHGIELGRIAAGIVVHPENPLESMSIDEVRSIFTGEVRKWPAVRGAAPVIHVFGLAHTDRTTQLLKEKLDVRTLRFSIEPDVEKVVLAVARDPAAIGFVDLARLSPAEKSVKLVPVLLPGQTLPKPTEAKDAEPKQAKGKGAKNKSSKSQAKTETDQPAASPETPTNPFSRTLVLYVSSNASQTAKDFADFLTPEHCAETLTRHGLLPPLPAALAVAPSQSQAKPSSLAAIGGPNVGSQSIPLDWEPPEVREERERREAEEAQEAASSSRAPETAASTSQGTKTPDNSARPPAGPHEQASKPIVPGLSNSEVLWLTGGVAGVVVFAVFAGWFNTARRRKRR